MIKFNLPDAQTNLSRYLDQVEQGEVLVICRQNQPVAELRAISPALASAIRVPGLLRGAMHWKDDAFAPMSNEEVNTFDAALLFPPPLPIPTLKTEAQTNNDPA